MSDPKNLVISCGGPQRIMGAMDAVMPHLGPDVRNRLNKIKLRYWQLHGLDGLFQRVNNRTVSDVIAEYDGDDPMPEATGEVDGVRYELVDSPKLPKSENKRPEGG